MLTLRLRPRSQRVNKDYSVAERLTFPLSIDLVSATSLYNRQAFCLSVEMIFAGFPCEIYSAKARKMKAWGEACRSPSQAALSELNSYLNVSWGCAKRRPGLPVSHLWRSRSRAHGYSFAKSPTASIDLNDGNPRDLASSEKRFICHSG